MRGGGRRPKPSTNTRPPPPSTPMDHNFRHRDSDASFASSRPSSVGVGGGGPISNIDLYKDRSYQQSALSSINAYLSSHSLQFSLKSPIPSAREITETLKFLISSLDWASPKLEDDLPLILKSLSCPFKLDKSIIRNPTVNSHRWPAVLAVIHWLFQLVACNDHLSTNSALLELNSVNKYALDSYSMFLRGDDDAVIELDEEFLARLEEETKNQEGVASGLESEAEKLEKMVVELRTGPSPREGLEKERSMLEEDVGKFNDLVEGLEKNVRKMEKVLEDKERALEAKREEKRRILEECVELKKTVESQSFSERDVERMKRELQALERDIGEAELARNVWEEKVWDVENKLGPKVKEIEALAMECNQVMRRLKLINSFQYALNPKGSTPSEVMGVDYKSTIKPALESYSQKIKKDSVEILDELILLQQKSSALSAENEGKRNELATLESSINEVEGILNSMKKEIQDYSLRCEEEARKLWDDVQKEAHDMNIVEREVAEVLKTSKMKLLDVTIQTEEETEKCAQELIATVDLVLKYKESVGLKISEMKREVSDTAAMISDTYKGSLQSEYSFLFSV